MSASLVLVEDAAQRAAWNACVAASPVGHFFQSWEWGELQEHLGGSPRRIAVMSEDRMVACAQVLIFDSGTRKFAYVPRGPVVDPADDGLVDLLVEAVLGVSAAEGAAFVKMEPQWEFQEPLAQRFQERGFARAKLNIMPARTLVVDLHPAPADIWAGFRSTTRNRIRMGEKLGVEVRVGSADDMATFVGLSEETSARHGLRLGRAEQFLVAPRLFGDDGMRLYLARADGVDWPASSCSCGARQRPTCGALPRDSMPPAS